jgi:hypothetical protein
LAVGLNAGLDFGAVRLIEGQSILRLGLADMP